MDGLHWKDLLCDHLAKIIDHFTHSLIMINRNSQVIAMPPPRTHSSLGVFKGMTINIMLTLVCVPVDHLAYLDH